MKAFLIIISFLNLISITRQEKVTSNNIEDLNDLRNKMIENELIPASEAKPPSNEYISVGAIACDVSIQNLSEGILAKLGTLIKSIFTYSLGTPIHFILITDEHSFNIVQSVVKRAAGTYITNLVIRPELEGPRWAIKAKIPKILFQFVDIKSITDNYRKEIDMMKGIYSKNLTEEAVSYEEDGIVVYDSPKYTKDLFYIGPFYGNTFINIKRLIMFDADLFVKKDLSNLSAYFDSMNSTQLIGVTREQTGYYMHIVTVALNEVRDKFLFTNDKEKIQGTNTGVVLYNLARMRESEEYQKLIKFNNILGINENFRNMASQNGFKIEFVCGDQEYFTLLMWYYPHLIQMIPCSWNYQSSRIMASRDYVCTEKPFIVHQHSA